MSASSRQGLVHQRGAGVARADHAGVDADAGATRLDASALEHRATLCLLSSKPVLERELGGDGKHEDRIDDPALADQLGGAADRGGADVIPEDRHQRGAIAGDLGRRVRPCSVGRAINVEGYRRRLQSPVQHPHGGRNSAYDADGTEPDQGWRSRPEAGAGRFGGPPLSINPPSPALTSWTRHAAEITTRERTSSSNTGSCASPSTRMTSPSAASRRP